MQITDPSPGERISLSRARAMPKAGQAGGPVVVEMTAEQRAMIEEFSRSAELDPAERARALAEQRKIKAHTIFTVGNTVVAMQWANGWTDLRQGGYAASDLGNLDGAQRRADYIEKALREVYGGQLQVHDYSADANAPTMGELEPVIQYKKTLREVLSSRSGGSGSTRQLLALTGSSLSLLHGRSR